MKVIGLESPMIYTKIQTSKFLGSGEKDFQWIFSIYVLGSHYGQRTRKILINFHSPKPRGLNMKFGYNQPMAFYRQVI